jgi:hypothetical protein
MKNSQFFYITGMGTGKEYEYGYQAVNHILNLPLNPQTKNPA